MTPTAEPTPRVLVASDDPSAAAFLTALLAREEIAADSGGADTAAASVAGAHPQLELVVVDADPATVRSIRSLADQDRARVPILVLGATDLGDDDATVAEATATDAGADVWLRRPVDDHDLVATVQQLLD